MWWPVVFWMLAAENPLVERDAFNGNVRVVVTGNTMAEPYIPNPDNVPPDPNLPDGLGCLLDRNTATTPALSLSSRARVLRAFLYFSGNYFQKGAAPPPLSTDVRNLVDRSVMLKVPGATSSQTVVANVADVAIASFTDGLLSPQRTSYFYSARVDITELVRTANSPLGTYELSGLSTPICPDAEVACVPGQSVQPQCASPYYVATASFVVVLVLADPAFAPRSVSLFDGLELLDGSNPERRLSLSGFSVPTIPRGEVSLYTIEGDVHLFGDSLSFNAGRGEALLGQVVNPVPSSPIFCGDASLPNWNNNVMDSSLVLDPSDPATASCVRGVDIDTFDVSALLQPGDTDVSLVARSTNTDRYGVVFAEIGIDTFKPILSADSRKEVLALGPSGVEPKTAVTYRIGLSNTGNLRATGLKVTDDLPPAVGDLKIERVPNGATDQSSASGGRHQTGRIVVEGISVEPGEVEEIRYTVTVTCPVQDRAVLLNSAVVSASAEGAEGLTLSAPQVVITDPNGDICAGRKQPNTPVTPNAIPLNRVLRGGAGCQTGGSSPYLGAALLLAEAARRLARKRWRVSLLCAAILLSPNCTCQRAVPAGPSTPPPPNPSLPPRPVTFPGVSCPGHDEMVQLTPETPGGVCIDRFEQVVEGDTVRQGYGSTPTGGLDFASAAARCSEQGKRLCTAAEWERGCRGVAARLYPYGDTFNGDTCNGFDADWARILPSGFMASCVSDLGVYDMSGNLGEWVDTDAPLANGTGKQVRGGSFVGNLTGLSCSAISPREPSSKDARAGLRCCR